MVFSIEVALQRVRQMIKTQGEPVVHHYRETPFTVLISCLLSLRTQDKTTDAASARLFKLAKTPSSMRQLSVEDIEKAIYPVGFYRTKARQISEISQQLEEKYAGHVPNIMEELLALPGVGRKTANLVRTLGHDLPGICVDIHVHRILNRWGYVQTKTPDETEMRLRDLLPKRYWKPLNGWIVSFGQKICQPVSPFCSRCSLLDICLRLSVKHSR